MAKYTSTKCQARLSFGPAASVVEARQPVRILREGTRQDLDGDIAVQLCVAGAIDLPHPADTDLFGNFVGTDPATGSERHVGAILI
jgi:hypothetical protein